jgi:trigger factor
MLLFKKILTLFPPVGQWTLTMNIQEKLLKVTDKKLENAQVELTVELPVETVQGSYDAVYKELQKSVKVDGFRKGKVPLSIVQSRFSGEADSRAAEKLVQDSFWNAVSEKKVSPISRPTYDFQKVSPDEIFTYTAIFDIPPTVELGKYKDLSAEEIVCKVQESDVMEEVDSVREKHSESTPKEEEDAQVEMGDLVFIKMKRVDGLTDEEKSATPYQEYNIIMGKSKDKPRIDEEIVGMKKGEEKEFTLKYPKDFPTKDIAGQSVTYKVVCSGISNMNLPELNDEFARKAGYDSKDDMVSKTRNYMEEFVDDRIKSEVKSDLMTQIMEGSTFDIPVSLVEQEMESIFAKTQERIGFKHDNMDEFAQVIGVDAGEFRSTLTDEAEKSIKSTLILSQIAKVEELKVDDERYREILSTIAVKNNKSIEEIEEIIEQNQNKQTIENDLLLDSATEFIYSNAKIKKKKNITIQELLQKG